MGWFSDQLNKLINKTEKTKYAEVMTGGAPLFSQFGQNVYASDVVQQAIACIVSEIKKLRPEHIRDLGNDITPVNSDLRRVLNNPNPLMTTADFLEKITWLLYLNYNVFIVPTFYEWKDKNGELKRKYEGLYPIQPSQVDFIEFADGRLGVNLHFANGQKFLVNYADIIHIRKNYSVNQYMGGNEYGQPDNDALLQTLDLNHQLLQGVKSAMKTSFSINGVVKYNTMMDDGKTEKALKELEGKLKRSENGFLPLDLKAEFIPINRNIQLVDEKTLKFIDEKILRNYGVSLPILTGDYTKAQYEAFYQKTVEPWVITFGQSFTKSLFTDGEKSHGNKIKFYPKELIFMSVDQTIQMVKELAPTGGLFENEKREAFGLRPRAELVGKRYMSLNWVDAEIAQQYQLNQNTGSNDGGNGDAE